MLSDRAIADVVKLLHVYAIIGPIKAERIVTQNMKINMFKINFNKIIIKGALHDSKI